MRCIPGERLIKKQHYPPSISDLPPRKKKLLSVMFQRIRGPHSPARRGASSLPQNPACILQRGTTLTLGSLTVSIISYTINLRFLLFAGSRSCNIRLMSSTMNFLFLIKCVQHVRQMRLHTRSTYQARAVLFRHLKRLAQCRCRCHTGSCGRSPFLRQKSTTCQPPDRADPTPPWQQYGVIWNTRLGTKKVKSPCTIRASHKRLIWCAQRRLNPNRRSRDQTGGPRRS